MTSKTQLKVLFFDIETAPMLAHTWDAFADYIPMGAMVHDTFMLTWAAKWADKPQVFSDKLTKAEVLAQDDNALVLNLADLLRTADIVVAHNGDRFDIPKLNGRLLRHKLEPLGPIQTIDTLKLSKRTFKLAYNKLDYLAQFLGLGEKHKTDFDLWLDVYHGDSKAMKVMLEYNKNDVVLLEEVFNAMKPYVPRLTRLYDGEGHVCPFCGHEKLQKRGFYRTQASTFQKYQCGNCDRYSRSRVSDKAKFDVHPL